MIPFPLDQRAATLDDEPFLRTLHASTREEEMAALEWPASVQEAWLRLQYDARDADQRRRFPGATQRLLLIEGEPAGRLAVDRSADAWTLLDIALLPAFRGLGFGSHALQGLLDEADAAGVAVRADVAADDGARRFLERAGFSLVTRDDERLVMARPAVRGVPTVRAEATPLAS